MGLDDRWKHYAGQWQGQTVWVVAGGSTSRYLAPGFLDDKNVVAVNYAGVSLELSSFWTVTNHWDDANEVVTRRPDLMAVTSQVEYMPSGWESGLAASDLSESVLQVPTIVQPYGAYRADQHWPCDGTFTIGPTSTHLALHWAAYLGAAHIVLVGVDCGEIDQEHHVPGYVGNLNGAPVHLHYQLWERTLRDIAGHLRKGGIGVHSLNPFVSLALEGHTFSN